MSYWHKRPKDEEVKKALEEREKFLNEVLGDLFSPKPPQELDKDKLPASTQKPQTTSTEQDH